MHRLGAVRHGAGPDQALPDRQAPAPGQVHLVGKLPGEGDAEDAARRAADLALAHRQEGERRRVEVDILDKRLQQRPRVRPRHGDGAPLLGDRGAIDLQLRPLGLEPFLQPLQHGGGVAAGRGHQVAVLAGPGGDPVVEHHAVLAEHQPVAAPPDSQRLPAVGVDAVQELGRVGAANVDLAERGGVEDAGGLAHGAAFARDRLAHGLAAARIVTRPEPLADRLEDRPAGFLPVLHRRAAHRVGERGDIAPRQRPERYRRVGRAEGGVADFRRRHAQPGRHPHASPMFVAGAPERFPAGRNLPARHPPTGH